jgi:NADH:ubiquinone oxidoreductase subunit 2 (subunit N)
MILAASISVALGGGLLSLAIASRAPRAAVTVAIVAAAIVGGLGIATSVDATLVVGSTALAASAAARLVEVGWAAGLLLLGIVGLATGNAAHALGAGLVALAAGVVALTVDGPTTAFAALAAGGLVAVLVPALAGWLAGPVEETGSGVATRAAVAAAGAGLAGVVLAAWSVSPAGPLGSTSLGEPDAAGRAAMGLAVLGMVAAIVVRSGAIPAHRWAARFVGTVSQIAVPSALAWGVAAFAVVAVRWCAVVVDAGSPSLDDADRLLILGAALASLLLGGLAAILHDDLEHVLGYTLVQDAGIALLAFTALRPETVEAATTWLVASAAVKTAFAGWIAASRWAFGTHRLSELRGWARRAPVLGGAYVVVLVGAVGVPGMAMFQARIDLASAALPAWLAPIVILAALSPVVALGRPLAIGLRAASPVVAAAPANRVGRQIVGFGGWSRGGPQWWLRTLASILRANEGLGAGVATLVLGLIGLAIAVAGAGTTIAS